MAPGEGDLVINGGTVELKAETTSGGGRMGTNGPPRDAQIKVIQKYAEHIPEIIAARHMGLKCCAISVVTDMCIPDLLKEAKLEYILAAAAKAEPNLTKLIGHLVSRA